jgi:hypothetical protein
MADNGMKITTTRNETRPRIYQMHFLPGYTRYHRDTVSQTLCGDFIDAFTREHTYWRSHAGAGVLERGGQHTQSSVGQRACILYNMQKLLPHCVVIWNA